jgi:hypothetical protein
LIKKLVFVTLEFERNIDAALGVMLRRMAQNHSKAQRRKENASEKQE